MNKVNAHAKPPAQDAYPRLIERLPVTLRPALNQQLSQWAMLFPFEQNRVVTFMDGVEALSPAAFQALTGPLFALEAKMDVRHWNFSEQADTIENASLLARSAYYADWRRETEKVFEGINAAARVSAPAQTGSTRLILLFLPASLPVDHETVWQQWDPRGTREGSANWRSKASRAFPGSLRCWPATALRKAPTCGLSTPRKK
jgi:hypothetical protein